MPETLVRALWSSLESCRVAEPPFRGQGPLAQARSHRERTVASNKVDRSISRVLSWTAIHLGPASPRASSDLPGPGAGHAHGSLFGLAPGGVCPAVSVTTNAVRSYRTFSPLPARHPKVSAGGIFSVALSVDSRRPDVIWHPALWSPDFPPAACTASGCLTDPGRILAETVNSEQLIVKSSRVGPGCRGGRARAHCVSANLRC